MKTFKLPDNFLMGSATAASQIEGSDPNTNWYKWGEDGKIANNGSTIVASDHYNRYEEDILLMKEMNHDIYRMSIEWSRIEPEPGVFSDIGLDYYRKELTLLKEKDIKVLVSLHHFSHPQWFEDLGQWEHEENIKYFLNFCEKVVSEYTDLISEYCTINEPNVFAMDTFIDGKYPPGKKNDMKAYFSASRNLIIAHKQAYEMIHSIRSEAGYTDTKVGFAHHEAYLEVKGLNPLTKLSKFMMNYAFHKIFLEGFINGRMIFPLKKAKEVTEGRYCDFLGLNYYSRHLIHSSSNVAMLFGEVRVDESLTADHLNDLNWEIYPRGLYQIGKRLYDEYKLPLYITENGIADAKDEKRSKFIYDHLYEVSELIKEGVKIERYYYWSLLDNLEWAMGYDPRFGLIEIDYTTLKRTIRESGRFYADICLSKEVNEEMISKYLKEKQDGSN